MRQLKRILTTILIATVPFCQFNVVLADYLEGESLYTEENFVIVEEPSVGAGYERDADSVIITKQPESVRGEAFDILHLSVGATGTGLSYQWQFKYPEDSGWLNSELFTRVALTPIEYH